MRFEKNWGELKSCCSSMILDWKGHERFVIWCWHNCIMDILWLSEKVSCRIWPGIGSAAFQCCWCLQSLVSLRHTSAHTTDPWSICLRVHIKTHSTEVLSTDSGLQGELHWLHDIKIRQGNQFRRRLVSFESRVLPNLTLHHHFPACWCTKTTISCAAPTQRCWSCLQRPVTSTCSA